MKRIIPTSPAFPSLGWGQSGQYPEHFLGMSLRQYYVGQLLAGGYRGLTLSDSEVEALFASADKLIKFENDEARAVELSNRDAFE